MSAPTEPRHPALSDTLVHFTSRTRERPDLHGRIASLGPQRRLEEIIRGERIHGFPTHWSHWPVVCLSESRDEDITHLIGERDWRTVGPVLSTTAVEGAGGGPVWYARTQQWDRIRNMDPAVAAELGQWIVRWDTGQQQRRSDWRHEREWRIPGQFLDLRVVTGVGVLIGDINWQFHPHPELDHGIPRGPSRALDSGLPTDVVTDAPQMVVGP